MAQNHNQTEITTLFKDLPPEIAAEVEKRLAEVREQTDIAKADSEKAKADSEKAKADSEKAKADSEKAKADLEKAKADTEKAKADSEKAKADSQKAKADLEKAKAETEKEKDRADVAVVGRPVVAKQGKLTRELQEKLEVARKQLRPTTFEECLLLSHDHHHLAISYPDNPEFCTKGSTDVSKKLCPDRLEKWLDFPKQLEDAFEKARLLLHPSDRPPERFLDPENSLESIGVRVKGMSFSSEDDTRIFQHFAVEDTVTRTISKLASTDIGNILNLPSEFRFENHLNPLKESADEQKVERMRKAIDRKKMSTPPKGKGRADSYCLWKRSPTSKAVAGLVVEYKPPHKYPLDFLSLGFRDMNVHEEVAHRRTLPPKFKEDDGNLSEEDKQNNRDRIQYVSDLLAATMATQIFDYMIQTGLEYGYLTTGECLIFCRIDQTNFETLQYYLLKPIEDARDNEGNFIYSKTAIAGILSLCLMAFNSSIRDQVWINNARSKLSLFTKSEAEVMSDLGPEQTPEARHSAYRCRKDPQFVRSPIRTRGKKVASDEPPQKEKHFRKDNDDDEGDEGGVFKKAFSGKSFSISTKTVKDKTSTTSGKQNSNTAQQQRSAQGFSEAISNSSSLEGEKVIVTDDDPFCTQACLLGLTNRTMLDVNCPNAGLHPTTRLGRHALRGRDVLRIFTAQVGYDPENGCAPMDLGGSRGVLFKIKLVDYGYTLVAKGTMTELSDLMLHEADVYQHLKQLQGVVVPVCFGMAKTRLTFFRFPVVPITHWLLLSYGGTMIAPGEEGSRESYRTMMEVRLAGVDQCDWRFANMLWNEELQRVFIIDFERAKYLPRSEKVIASVGLANDNKENVEPFKEKRNTRGARNERTSILCESMSKGTNKEAIVLGKRSKRPAEEAAQVANKRRRSLIDV